MRGSVHPPKPMEAGINTKPTRFPFSLPPLLFYRLPSTVFWLQTKYYSVGLATSLTHPSAAMTCWYPALSTSESFIFGGVTLSAQDKHPDSSNTTWKRQFPRHARSFGSVKQEANAAEPATSARKCCGPPAPACLPSSCAAPCGSHHKLKRIWATVALQVVIQI